MLKNEIKVGILFLHLFSCSFISAQDIKSRELQKIIIRIEEGMKSGSVDKFSIYFGSRNYISLINGSNGYYSANQSYYVLKDFLSVYQPISFKITNMVIDTNNPFAAGVLKYNSKGIRGSATVFITLGLQDDQWRITQITIN
jgi:hypothetical protein